MFFFYSYNNGSSRSTNRASVYSVDITEASIGSEPEPEHMTNINGGGSHNSGSEETIVGNGNNHELHNGVLHWMSSFLWCLFIYFDMFCNIPFILNDKLSFIERENDLKLSSDLFLYLF